jgi:hypothetical protein
VIPIRGTLFFRVGRTSYEESRMKPMKAMYQWYPKGTTSLSTGAANLINYP